MKFLKKLSWCFKIDDDYIVSIIVNSIPQNSNFCLQDDSQPVVNMNDFHVRKNFASGLIDAALFSSNATQLRDILELWPRGLYFDITVTLIIISMILQVFIGIGFVLLGRYDIEKLHHSRKANKLNNYIVLAVMLIAFINLMIPVFQPQEAKGIKAYESNSTNI